MSKHASSTPKSTPAADNRSRQLNDQHDAYWQSRGQPERPSYNIAPAPPSAADPVSPQKP